MTNPDPNIDERIWQVVFSIPPGKVATYGDVAALAGLPGAARRVGRALRGLPADTRIPWHRVINAAGKLSLPANASTGRTQRRRLEDEGVVFGPGSRVDMKRFRWTP